MNGILFQYFKATKNEYGNFDLDLGGEQIQIKTRQQNIINSLNTKIRYSGRISEFRYFFLQNDALVRGTLYEITNIYSNLNDIYNFQLKYIGQINYNPTSHKFDFNEYRIDGQTPADIQYLHLSYNNLCDILGKIQEFEKSDLLHIYKQNVTSYTKEKNDKAVLPALRLRFSQIPDNLKYDIYGNECKTGQNVDFLFKGATQYKEWIDENESIKREIKAYVNCFNKQATAIIPLPFIYPSNIYKPTKLKIIDGKNPYSYKEAFFDFNTVINDLILANSDLLESIDLILIDKNSLLFQNGNTNAENKHTTPFKFWDDDSDSNEAKYVIELTGTTKPKTTETIRFFNKEGYKTPFIFLGTTKDEDFGAMEVLHLIEIPFRENDYEKSSDYKQRNYLFLNIFNDIIDISRWQPQNKIMYKADMTNTAKLYIDTKTTILSDYIELQTSLEFEKNAYSDFEAYKKANIELVQQQEKAQLKINQTKNLASLGMNQLFSSISNKVNALGKFLTGGLGLDDAFSSTNLSGLQDVANLSLNTLFENLLQKNQFENQLYLEQYSTTAGTTLNGSKTIADIPNAISCIYSNIFKKESTTSYSEKNEFLFLWMKENQPIQRDTEIGNIETPPYCAYNLFQIKMIPSYYYSGINSIILWVKNEE